MATSARRAAIYARISRDKTGGGLGVERQEGDCRDLAERFSWPVSAGVYVDNDLSAYSGKRRPEYRRLLADIEAGVVDTVLCWHTDRLHRSPLELEEWIAVCEPRGVEVHTVKAGPIDLATPSGRMIARQLGAVARYESEHRSERVTTAIRDIIAAGGFTGGTRPFGYGSDGTTLIPAEATLITSGTESILAGRSLRSVVTAWNQAGAVTTKAKKPWAPAAVRDVLMRARNAALVDHHGAIVGKAAWPAVVTEAQWRGVCAILDDPARRTSPGNRARWLGSHLYRCGICGEPMVVGTSGAIRNPSYRCKSANRGGQRHVTRRAGSLDEFVEEIIIGRLSMPDAVELFAAPEPVVDTAHISAEIVTISSERDELAARLGRGDITMTMFDAAASGYATREQELQGQLAASAKTSDPVRDIVTADDVREQWNNLDLATRRDVLDALFVVTVLPAGRGRQPNGTYFDPGSVRIEPRT